MPHIPRWMMPFSCRSLTVLNKILAIFLTFCSDITPPRLTLSNKSPPEQSSVTKYVQLDAFTWTTALSRMQLGWSLTRSSASISKSLSSNALTFTATFSPVRLSIASLTNPNPPFPSLPTNLYPDGTSGAGGNTLVSNTSLRLNKILAGMHNCLSTGHNFGVCSNKHGNKFYWQSIVEIFRSKQSMVLSHLWRSLTFKGCRSICTVHVCVPFSFLFRCAHLPGTTRKRKFGCCNQCIWPWMHYLSQVNFWFLNTSIVSVGHDVINTRFEFAVKPGQDNKKK